MEKHRYRTKHIRENLIKEGMPGNWMGRSGTQNIYNLIDAKSTPKDGAIYIFLSNFLKVSLVEILNRYSLVVVNDKSEINW